MSSFKYSNGDEVTIGERVLVNRTRIGIVKKIFEAFTEDAKDWSCNETGGVLITFDDGDPQVWAILDEDIEKI